MTEDDYSDLCAFAQAIYEGHLHTSVDIAFTRADGFLKARNRGRYTAEVANSALAIYAANPSVNADAAFARAEGFARGKEARRAMVGSHYQGTPMGAPPQAFTAGPSPSYAQPSQTPLASGSEPRTPEGYGPADITRQGAASNATMASVAPPTDPNEVGSHEGCDVECFRSFVHCGKCRMFAHGGTCDNRQEIGRVPRPQMAKKAAPSNFRGPTKDEPAHLSDPNLPK